MKSTRIQFAIVAAILAGIPLAHSRPAPMIEATTPFLDANGLHIMAIPVVIRRAGDDRVEIVPLSVQFEEGTTEITMLPVYSIRLSTPQSFSASLGVVLGSGECRRTSIWSGCHGQGILIQVEPGFGGIKGSLGYADVRTLSHGGPAISGWGMKASVLHTWGDAHAGSGDDVYAGLEAEANLLFLNFALGLLHEVAGESSDPDWLFIAGVGFGF